MKAYKQVESKTLGQSSRVIYIIRQKKNHMSENEWILSCTERLYSQIHTLTNWHFTYQWHRTLLLHFPYLTAVESSLLISLQHVLKISSAGVYVWTRQITGTVATFQTIPRRLQVTWQTLKGVGEVSLHFQLELNAQGSLSAPPPAHAHTHTHTHKYRKEWG
jgi:hypothetical protein